MVHKISFYTPGHPLAKTMRPKIASLGKIAKEEVTYIKVLSPF